MGSGLYFTINIRTLKAKARNTASSEYDIATEPNLYAVLQVQIFLNFFLVKIKRKHHLSFVYLYFLQITNGEMNQNNKEENECKMSVVLDY